MLVSPRLRVEWLPDVSINVHSIEPVPKMKKVRVINIKILKDKSSTVHKWMSYPKSCKWKYLTASDAAVLLEKFL